MNQNTYTNKCFSILNSSQFTQLNHDPTDKSEQKLQQVIRKLKPKLLPTIYSNIYPSTSCPGKFYGTAKIHKMSPNDSVQHLSIQPIVSNIGTATNHLSKYLVSLLTPLSESEYTVQKSKSFAQKVFLDVLMTRDKNTLQTLVKRAYDICSTNEHLQNNSSHIKKVFHEQNQYPFWAINKVFCEIKRNNHQQLQEQHQ